MYEGYPIKPYISPERDLATEDFKPVPKRNMEPLTDELLAGDIILLWRIQFGTFTTETWFPKYFEYTYGIDASKHLQDLIERQFTYVESAFDSLDHITATLKKKILKQAGVTGLTKMKTADLDQVLRQCLTEEELGLQFSVRGIALTEKGEAALAINQTVIDRHPKKSF